MPGHGAFVSDFQLTWFDLIFDYVNIPMKMRMALFLVLFPIGLIEQTPDVPLGSH